MDLDKEIAISGIWLRSNGNALQVLVEIDGEWRVAIDEYIGGLISHIAEVHGIKKARRDDIVNE